MLIRFNEVFIADCVVSANVKPTSADHRFRKLKCLINAKETFVFKPDLSGKLSFIISVLIIKSDVTHYVDDVNVE